MINIAIFASGNGSNAQRIADFFSDHNNIRICKIYCNNPKAYVLERAANLDIPAMVFSKPDFTVPGPVSESLKNDRTDWIILAGFLWLIPAHIVKLFPNKIVNIHPALLPNYGGKGMYGPKVHEAVISNGESTSGITIHYVNEKYDDGQIIFQASCNIAPSETTDSLASKIHELEYEYYPSVIQDLVEGKL